PVWICGDCHLGNLGSVADAHGRVKIAIRDLDQTVIGNPAHDLIRLGLSLATAIRGSDLPGVTTALMLEQMVEGYEGELGKKHKHSRNPTSSVQRVLEGAVRRRWHHLADECIEGVTPEIPFRIKLNASGPPFLARSACDAVLVSARTAPLVCRANSMPVTSCTAA